jgi:hypothetical protein
MVDYVARLTHLHLPHKDNNTNIRYALAILTVTFACLCQLSAPGIIMLSQEQEFHWRRETISNAAINLFLFGLAGSFLDRLLDVYVANHHHFYNYLDDVGRTAIS